VVDQPVTGVVQPDAVAQLRMKDAHQVVPRRKGLALGLYAMALGKLFDETGENEFTNLLKYRQTVLGWFGFVHNRVSSVGNPLKPTIFFYSSNIPMDGCGMRLIITILAIASLLTGCGCEEHQQVTSEAALDASFLPTKLGGLWRGHLN
jgi:hypothetical protein